MKKSRLISIALALCITIFNIGFIFADTQETRATKQLRLNTTVVENLTEDTLSNIYEIKPSKSGNIEIKIESQVKQMIVEFFDKDYNRISFQWVYKSELGPGKYTINTGLNPNIYYLKISDGNDNKAYTGLYTLTNTFEEANNEETEPNDGTVTANYLSMGKSITGFLAIDDRADRYKIYPTRSGNIDLTIESEVGQMLVEFFDENNKRIFFDWVYGSKSSPAKYNKKIKVSNKPYYVRVSGSNKLWVNTGIYKLKVDYSNFKDTDIHWAKDYINDFVNKGYINGYEDGTFRPDNYMTRAEFVKVCNKTFGLSNGSGKVFNDTGKHWAKHEIDIAVTNGLAKGISKYEFRPDDLITREQAAKMVSNYKYLDDNNHDKLNFYIDNYMVSGWAKSSVEGMIERGYMKGYEDRTFRPHNNMTRAEAVVTLSRVK